MDARDVWSARVRGGGGRFEWARLSVAPDGEFVFTTGSDLVGSEDRAVIDRADVERLADVLVDELDPDAGRAL